MLNQLMPLMPSNLGDLRLVEPCMGGAAVFFGTAPRRAVLADVNRDLVLLYRELRDNLDEVCGQLGLLEQSHFAAVKEGLGNDHFVRWRSRYNQAELPLLGEGPTLFGAARAAVIVYLSKTCFNGLYRLNRDGQFNVGYCHAERHNTAIAIYRREELMSASELLQRAEVQCQGFEETLAVCGEGDFVFADPPYMGTFDGYTPGGFGPRKHALFRDALERAVKRGARVMVCNSFDPDVFDLYAESGMWNVATVARPGNMNSKGSERGAVPEYVFRNYQ